MEDKEIIEKEAIERLRNNIPDFHLMLKKLADYMENEPLKFKLAMKILKS